ncbi:MAG: hypothetical protein NTW55_04155 [Planctomycetota bacterium]|nr:hypothetical protein [Planctomycetota bacterium]
MEDSKKKPVMIGVVVVCLIVAAVVFIKTSSQDSASTANSQQTIWIKCTACGAEYQIDSEKFNLAMEKSTAPLSTQASALVCEKCSKESAYRAEKCPRCEAIFIVDSTGICPKCGLGGPEGKKNAAAEKK